MKYKIIKQIIIENPNYGALGDDFSFNDLEAIDFILNKMEKVLSEETELESVFGKICYRINITKRVSFIYCYDEFLGEEATVEVYSMFKDYKNLL